MTLFTSATERTAFVYLLSSIGVALFGGVYEIFSHGVWSAWMVYAFAFPLVLGALPYAVISLRQKPMPHPWRRKLHHAAVATLTVGSVMEGVFAIYGTTSHLTIVYWIVGISLLVLSLLLRLIRK